MRTLDLLAALAVTALATTVGCAAPPAADGEDTGSDDSAVSTNVVDKASVRRAVEKDLVGKRLTATKAIAFAKKKEKDGWTAETYATFAAPMKTGTGEWNSMYCTLDSKASADALKVDLAKGTGFGIKAVEALEIDQEDVMVHPGQHVKTTKIRFGLALEADDAGDPGLTASCELWEKWFFSSAALAVE